MNLANLAKRFTFSVADPGFPAGGGGRGLPRQLHFENFVCRNERIWTLRGACAGHASLDPSMFLHQVPKSQFKMFLI